MKKIVLAYSGGLDTSIILKWLQINYKAEVIAYTSNIGQDLNKKKIINILNENIFTSDDCIVIIRSFIIKAKRILILSNKFEANKNIDLTISSAKPPIFWKDKEITKNQILKWRSKNIKKLIFKLSEIELLIKKNLNNSVNVITDFVLDQSS